MYRYMMLVPSEMICCCSNGNGVSVDRFFVIIG